MIIYFAAAAEGADDGDSNASVDDAAPAATFKVGHSVAACYHGGEDWFEGTVAAVNADGTYDVNYSDGDHEAGVTADHIKSMSDINNESPDVDEDAALAAAFKVGHSVAACYHGGEDWFEGTVAAVNADGTYDVNYSDGDHEAGVTADHIKSMSDINSEVSGNLLV